MPDESLPEFDSSMTSKSPVKKPSGNATSGPKDARRTSMADPIHGLIHFDRNDPSHNLLLAVTNTFAFQRLRRIRQMGLAEFVFPGATHSRFVHSLGAAHLMIQVIEHLGVASFVFSIV